MTQGANYVGRRVVVLAGDDSRCADRLVRPLVDAGAEVHVVGGEQARAVALLASRTPCDLADVGAVDAAVARIGAVVQHLFHWGSSGDEQAGFAAVAVTVRPLMVIGGSIVVVRSDRASPDDPADRSDAAEQFVRDHASEFAAADIRLVVARPDDALGAGLA